MRKERGFTLIELLIVLAILAILIGIVALSMGNLRQVTTKRAMQSERETVETALNAYATLQDPTLPVNDQTEPTQILATDDWGVYLKRDTKYYYTWVDVAEPTQNVTVWNDATEPTICCTVDGCAEDSDKDGVAGEPIEWDTAQTVYTCTVTTP